MDFPRRGGGRSGIRAARISPRRARGDPGERSKRGGRGARLIPRRIPGRSPRPFRLDSRAVRVRSFEELKTGSGYLPALDGIRALAFFLVFVLHSLSQLYFALPNPERLSALVRGAIDMGRFGVSLFFVLSSFLVTRLLLTERARFGRIDVKAFLLRRGARIWPLYVLLIVALLGVRALHLPLPSISPREFLVYALFQGDIYHLFVHAGTVAYLWTIAVEEKFYVLWPFVLGRTGLGRIGQGAPETGDATPRRLFRIALGLVAAAWIFRLLLAWNLPEPWFSVNPLAYLDAFGYGALLALSSRRDLARVSPLLALGLFLVAIWLASSLGFLIDVSRGHGAIGFTITQGLAAGASALLIGALAEHRRGWPVFRPFIEVGKRSYGAYLFHVLVLIMLEPYALDAFSGRAVAVRVVALAVTLALAFLSYRFVEAPFLRLKKRLERVESRPV
ncbi:acyltransferase [bacterium]|nr:MAG: acyltransferase [bacterium]